MGYRQKYTLSHKTFHGFTLVELLVVISIIALLLAILMPSLQKARQQAVSVVCRSNICQNQLALIFYLDANDGYFPQSTTARNARWYVLLNVAGYQFAGRRCPSARNTGSIVNNIAYAYNAGLGHVTGPPWGQARRINIRSEKSIITFSETYGNFFWNSQIGQGVKCGEPVDQRRGLPGRLTVPHSDGQNISFLDGHMEYRKIKSLDYRDWSVDN